MACQPPKTHWLWGSSFLTHQVTHGDRLSLDQESDQVHGLSAVLPTLGDGSQCDWFSGQHPRPSEFVSSHPSTVCLYGWGAGQRGSQGWDESRWRHRERGKTLRSSVLVVPCQSVLHPGHQSSRGSWAEPRPCLAIQPDPATPRPCVSSPAFSVPPIPTSASPGHWQLRASFQSVHTWCSCAGWQCGGGQVSSLFLFSLHCPGNILYSQLIPFNYTTIKHIIKT